MTRAIRRHDKAATAKAARKLAKELRPKKDAAEIGLADELATVLETGRVSDAADPRIRSIGRELIRDTRPPHDVAPWSLHENVALLKDYCVEPSAWLSHNIRRGGIVTHDKLISISSDFGNNDKWREYWTRVRNWVRAVTTKNDSGDVVVIVEDRCAS